MKRIIQLGMALAAAVLSLGCAGHQCHREDCACGPGYNCYGYYSTCWRPWPEECPACPSFAILPPPHEELISDEPLPEPLPARPRPTLAPPDQGAAPPRIQARAVSAVQARD